MMSIIKFCKNRYKDYLLNKLCKLKCKCSDFFKLATFCDSVLAIEEDRLESCLCNYKCHPYDSSYLSDYNHCFETYLEYKKKYNYYFSQYELYSRKIVVLEEKLNNL